MDLNLFYDTSFSIDLKTSEDTFYNKAHAFLQGYSESDIADLKKALIEVGNSPLLDP